MNDPAQLNNLLDASNTLEVFPPLASTHDPKHSITVGRTLSAYTTKDLVNNSLIVTYTVYNETGGHARGTLLTTTLGSGVTFVSSSILPDRNGQELAWSMGTLAPFERASVTVTVALADSITKQIDTGAKSFATLDTVAVSDSSPAAILRTDTISPDLLAATPDANSNDPFVQEQAAKLDYDPQAIFDFLRTEIGYESYAGSLRGARGTLWSSAGNSLDVASLGVALYRASGIPARYAHGTLPDTLSQQLILSMFPTSFQTVGYIPAGTTVSDPANDPRLLAEARDHYWLQVDTGSGFANVDASHLLGSRFGIAFTEATDTFSEVADGLRHKSRVKLDAETYSSASAIFGGLTGNGLSTSTVLDQTFNDVDLVGRPITFGNFVSSSASSALFLAAQTNTYSPYLILGDDAYPSNSQDELITGITFQETLTNLPFGSQILTGLSLYISIVGPGSDSQTYVHTIFDRIGAAARQTGQATNLAVDLSDAPPISSLDSTTIEINTAARVSANAAIPNSAESALKQFSSFAKEFLQSTSTEQQAILSQGRTGFNVLLTGVQRAQLAGFEAQASYTEAILARSLKVAAYLDSPRITIASTTLENGADDNGKLVFRIDLARSALRVLVASGQTPAAAIAFNINRGFLENQIEGAVLARAQTGATNSLSTRITASEIFTQATQEGIALLVFRPHDVVGIASLPFSADVLTRLQNALSAGHTIIVPSQYVTLDDQPTIGWYQVDETTGDTVGVLADGSHGGIAEWAIMQENGTSNATNPAVRFMFGLLAGAFASGELVVIRGLLAQAAVNWFNNSYLDLASTAKNYFLALKTKLDETVELLTRSDPFFKAGYLVGSAVMFQFTADPPLPQALIDVRPFNQSNVSGRTIDVLASSLPTGPVQAQLDVASLSLSGTVTLDWVNGAKSKYAVEKLTVDHGEVRDANGNIVGSGRLLFAPTVKSEAIVFGSARISVAGTGNIDFYHPAEQTLGVSADWENYVVNATGDVSISLTALEGGLTLNGQFLPDGKYTLTTDAATLSGSGPSTSPVFSDTAFVSMSRGTVNLGSHTGTLTVGGNLVDLSSSTTLAGYNGSLTVTAAVNGSDVSLSGDVQQVLMVTSTPASISIDQNMSASFQAKVNTSFADTYTFAVEAPPGWAVTIDATGNVTAKPVPGTQMGTFPVRVIARSNANPALIAQTIVNISVAATSPALDFQVAADPIFTIPYLGAQVPSAFRATLQNLGPATDTYNLTFANLPTSFNVVNSATQATIPAGETGTLGLYLEPTSGVLPTVGTVITFDVTATSATNSSITQTRTVSFTVPEIRAVTTTATPTALFTVPGTSVSSSLDLHAVGNTSANVELTLVASSGLTVTGLPAMVSMNSGANLTIPFSITASNSVALNSDLLISILVKFGSNPDVEQQRVFIPVRVVVPGADAIALAAVATNQLGNSDLANRWNDLSFALTNLVLEPTNAVFKAQAVASLETAVGLMQVDANLAGFVPALLGPQAALMAAQTPSEIQAAVSSLGAALDGFGAAVTALAKSNFELFLLPNTQIALPQIPTQFELRVHNIGSHTSTYNVALHGIPAGVTATLSEQQVTLDRDAMASVMVTLAQNSANELLQFGFSVDVTVDGTSEISKSARGTLTARREFVSVVSLTATPPFTDAGGTLDVSARLLNSVNREQKARVSFVVRDSTGTPVRAPSSPVDVTLTVQSSLVTLPLGSIDTTDLANGSYSIVMTLLDLEGNVIPGGTGSTTFLVGSPLTASIDAAPSVLPLGTNNVTNTLKIEALAPLVSPPTLGGQAAVAGASDVVRNGDVVYVAGSNGISVFDIAGANLQNPQLLRTVGSATSLLEQRGDLLVSVLSRPGGGSTTLTTFSLTDPTNPTQLGTTGDIPYGTAADLIVTDTHAFIVLVNIVFTQSSDIIDQNGGLMAINISDPAAPFFDGDAVSAKGTPAGRDGINDGVLFNDNGTNNDGIKNPLGIDQSGGNQNTWSVVQVSPTILLLSGSTATGTDTQNGVGVVRVVDISDPRNMRLLRDLQIPGTVHVLDVAVSGNRALLTASQGGLADLTVGFPFTGNVVLATLNISDPANPQIIHQQTLDRAARGVDHATALDNGLFAISNLGATADKPGLLIVDASDPNSLGIGGMDVPAGINELIGGDGSIFTTDGASMIVYAVPPKNPLTLVGQVPISGGLRGVATRNNIAYASGTNGIQIIDYSDPKNPTIVGTIPGNHFGARIQDNVLLALRPEGRSFYLDVYALQNTPLAPPLIGSSPLIRYDLAADLTSNSTHAFVGTFNVCFFLGSKDIYRQLGDQLAIKLNLDSIDNPTIATPTLDSVLFNTHGDNTFDPTDVSGCAESGGDHLVYGVALATPNTSYLATTTATQGNTQVGVGRIEVVDVTDGANPMVLKSLDIPGTVLTLGVSISGNVGVVVGSTQGFQDNPNGVIIGDLTVTTLDVTDRLNPKIVTTRTLDRPTSTFWVNFSSLGGGRFAFASQGIVGNTINPSILVIDASNPRSPLIGDSSIPIDLIAPNSLGTDGKFLFTADSGGVSIYTVNPLPGLPVTARVQIPNGTGVAPIPGSFNIPPAEVISGADFDTYVFDLTLAPSLPSETLTWQTVVVGLKPGESRSVTLGTTIDFAFQGTAGQIALPRTVVAAEQVLSLAPAIQTVRPGGEADYTVAFINPSSLPVTYDLSIGGVPSQWVSIDSTVTVPAGGTATKSLRLATGAFDVVGDYGFLVNAVVDGVTTSVAGTLVLVGAPILPDAKPDSQGVVVSLTPTSAIAGQGTAATYVAHLTNVGSQADEFVLSAAGLPSGFQATFALDSVNVPPGTSNFREVLLTVTPPQGTDAGDYPFIVTATSASDASIADDATSTLSVLDIGVAVEVTPESGSPESTYQMLVTNIGQVRETFDLSLAAPAALMATLGVSSVTLEPGQSTSVPIDVGAIDFALPGSLSLVGVATSRSNPLVRAADGVGVDIAGLIAMTATLDKSTQILPLPGTSSFLLLVDNIGNIEDQYSATIKSTNGPVTANLVGLQGERTQSVPRFILPGLSRGAILLNAELLSAGLGTITVTVKSLTDDSVSTEITAQLQAGEQTEPIADLSLVMTVDNASAKVGQNVTFTVALHNAGPDGATGVNVLDKLPTGLQFVNATTSSGSYSATTGLWNVGSLAQGATTTLTIVATLLTDQAVSNVAQVATSDQRDPDSTPGNNVDGEDDQFSAGVGTCLTGGPLEAGMNRLVFSCVTPGGFAAFVVGSQPGSYHYSQWGTTVDIADPGVPAIGVGNINGVAVVLVNLTAAQLAHPLYVQAFEMLPAHKVSNLIVAQHTLEKTGTPLVADTIGLGTSPDSLAALQSATPALKAAALNRWQTAGVSELLLEHLAAIDILFSDLPNDQLAATQGNFIVLDANAAGHGWFVDTTPGNDAEFTRDASGAMLANIDAARDHIDALTVILHEMGHVLGEPDEPTSSANRLMSESLSPGMRRLPTAVTTPSLGALDVNRDGLVTPMDVLLIINELNLATGRLARTTVAGNVLDVTGDGLLTPIDALQVINYLNRVSPLNRGLALAEGESSPAENSSDHGILNALENSLVDESLLEALAADALNAWLEAQRTSRLKLSGHL